MHILLILKEYNVANLKKDGSNRAFNILHGRGGEKMAQRKVY